MSALHAQAPPDEETARGASASRSDEKVDEVIVGADDAARKRESHARAIAALNGIALHKVIDSDGGCIFIATKWNLTRELRSLDEVAGWLDYVTGMQHGPGLCERERRTIIDAENREQDRRNEAVDLKRGPRGDCA